MKLSTQFITTLHTVGDGNHLVPAPYLRKAFCCCAKIQEAALSICGLGFYEVYLNGQNITKGPLAPYVSNPDDLVYYDVYDIAPLLLPGENVLGIWLGNGMQNAWGGAVWDFDKAKFRGAPRVALCVEMTDADGNRIEIEADDSFRTHQSPILSNDLRIGERYDARCEIPDWNQPKYDDSAWGHAVFAEQPRGKAVTPIVEPIVVTGELPPVSVARQGDGWLYDFGVNMAGVCRMVIQGDAGQEIDLYYGEHLADGQFSQVNIGFPQAPDYRQQDTYVCKGGEPETYTPRFTYHGFRYVLVKGLREEQATEELLTYLVMNTDLRERGNFHCSNETVNTLQLLVRRSTLSNFYYFPTDCPHREKNGWTADAALSAEHTLLNLTPERGYRDWMRNICLAMSDKGALPGIVPTGGWGFHWGNGPAWDAVLIDLPYFTYHYRYDTAIVEESAHTILRYLDYLMTRLDKRGLLAIGLGDWCQPEKSNAGIYDCPLTVSDSIIAMDLANKAEFLFGEIGCQPQAAFARSVMQLLRESIRAHLVDWSTCTVQGGCQTAQALALFYDVFEVEEKPAAFQRLLEFIHAKDDHIGTGVLGGRVIFHVLAEFGHSNLAFKMITQPTAPSYGDWVRRGAVTLWEDFAPEGGTVTSHNHHFWGDISGWFIKHLAGIQYNPNRRNWHEVDIRPCFVEALSSASGWHECLHGRITTTWQRMTNGVLLEVVMPEEMTGHIYAPPGYVFVDGQRVTELNSSEFTLIKT